MTPVFIFWHSRLGHVSFPRLRYMVNKILLGSVTLDKDPFCVACKLAKQSTIPFNNSITVSSFLFDLVHSHVWGKSPIAFMGGALYYVVIVDDYSRYS